MVSNSRDLALALVVVIFAVGMFFTINPNFIGLVVGSSAKQQCSDTDGGLNTSVRGTVTVYYSTSNSSSRYVDSCVNSSNVNEYSCTSSSTHSLGLRTIQCRNGYSCSNGACIVTPRNSTNQPANLSWVCTDSDGLNRNTYGSVVWTSSNGSRSQFNDFCDYDGKVSEYFCVSPTQVTTRTSNPNAAMQYLSCLGLTACHAGTGHCTPLVSGEYKCVDSDSGSYNPSNTRGTVTLIGRNSEDTMTITMNSTDSCTFGNRTVLEYSCDNGAVQTTLDPYVHSIPCAGTCVNGACTR